MKRSADGEIVKVEEGLQKLEIKQVEPIEFKLGSLSYNFCRFDIFSKAWFREALKSGTSTTHLYMYACGIDDAFAKEIAEILLENRTLVELDLNYNLITDEGARCILNSLSNNWAMMNLRLFVVIDPEVTLSIKDLSKRNKNYATELSHRILARRGEVDLDASDLYRLSHGAFSAVNAILKIEHNLKHLEVDGMLLRFWEVYSEGMKREEEMEKMSCRL